MSFVSYPHLILLSSGQTLEVTVARESQVIFQKEIGCSGTREVKE